MWLHVWRSKWQHGGKGESKAHNSKQLLLPLRCSLVTLEIHIFHTCRTRIESADCVFLFKNGAQKTTDTRGQTHSHSHLHFLAILLIPIPPLHWPSNQNKIVISTRWKALPFYWWLSDARFIVSDLGFDKPTRERLVLQGESMVAGHIAINRLPQLFSLPTVWQIKCFIRNKTRREQRGGWWR